jgi:hypothetical protein
MSFIEKVTRLLTRGMLRVSEMRHAWPSVSGCEGQRWCFGAFGRLPDESVPSAAGLRLRRGHAAECRQILSLSRNTHRTSVSPPVQRPRWFTRILRPSRLGSSRFPTYMLYSQYPRLSSLSPPSFPTIDLSLLVRLTREDSYEVSGNRDGAPGASVPLLRGSSVDLTPRAVIFLHGETRSRAIADS